MHIIPCSPLVYQQMRLVVPYTGCCMILTRSHFSTICLSPHIHEGRLDLAIVSACLAPRSSWAIHPLLTSDHFGGLVDIHVVLAPTPPQHPRFHMRDAKWGLFLSSSEDLFTIELHTLPLDAQADRLSAIILQAAHLSISVSKPHARLYKDRWIYCPRLEEIIRRVNATRKQFRRHPSPSTRSYLQSVVCHAQAVKTRLSSHALLHWCQGISSHTPLGCMWRRVRAICSSGPPPLPTHPAPAEEAERLAELFAARTSPATLPSETRHMQQLLADSRTATIHAACAEEAESDAPFTTDELTAALHNRPDTAPGSDQGKAALLALFNLSLATVTLPASLKTATIQPIPKPKDPGAMRPISLLSCPSKILERLVLVRLKLQIGELHPSLFANQANRSTTTCLMTLLGPCVPDSSAQVRFQGRLSTLRPHSLGTPQGSCLSPFLCNILMEGLFTANYRRCVQLLCYADDLPSFFLDGTNLNRYQQP
ncbi:hypothetical protein GWK47_005777 [Chionoecetes opilio]|uniref:Reverse transcriptase domain-containing protein n=1 Tax=Chionoecetes opilio TaxID=41210 RepID=A0A8J4YG56_CHIOP|nr:hypothetical protein GWK47_005777 [Chionoecetes opilio]